MKTILSTWGASRAFGLFLFATLFTLSPMHAQECTTNMSFVLVNIEGGVFSGQTVICESLSGGTFTERSDSEGKVSFALPCETSFKVKIDNYTRDLDIMTPKRNGAGGTRTISYMPNMAENDAFFAMSAGEKKVVDEAFARYPDTTHIKNSTMTTPRNRSLYAQFTLELVNLDSDPLVGEVVTFTGEKRDKSFKGETDANGRMIVWLPKGDDYVLNFKYQKDFKRNEVGYTKGTAEERMQLMYMGSEEHLRRIKEEEERIRKEEERLKAEEEAFKAWCKKKGITEEEGHKRALAGEYPEYPTYAATTDTVVSAVLNRNNWSEKLIVTDLTGSMNPYAGQLSAWYQLNYKVEPNLQFVFFNDGSNVGPSGKTLGGIFYQKAQGIDPLMEKMTEVRSNGNGGDCPENNMEALIEGVRIAGPYKELVMIVDNNAPVKDIERLKEFNRPVHIILCGYRDGVLLDYLEIAWKTGGSIHTIEEDITKIAKMAEGQSIKVGAKEYKIMGGKFVAIYNN